MTSIIENNRSTIKQSILTDSSMHENKSCEKYTLSDARKMASDLNNISLFLKSGAWQASGDEDSCMLASLLDKLQLKVEDLESCLGYLEIYPQIKALELLEANH